MNPNPNHQGSRAIRAAVRLSLFASAVVAAGLPLSTAFAAEEELEAVIVTGSILRRTDTETASPITVLTEEVLAERGINTVAEAIQRLPMNNAGTITTGWNTGFNFASGATAPALRGLTVQSTLSVADGLRMAPYPLADDGQRNFVDLNTIPSAIVERLEILRDGASSTYGADAIAGVVNVITKKEIQGLHIGGSYGIAQEGDANEGRVDITWGIGDLQADGYNFYVSGEYMDQSALWAKNRGYPFNTMDLQRICGPSGSCMPNLNWNSVTAEDGATHIGFVSIPGVGLVRPITNPTGSAGVGRYQYMNPAAGCRDYPSHNNGAAVNAAAPLTLCEVNNQEFIMLQPDVERVGFSSRFTKNIGDMAQVYAMVNWYETTNHAEFTPLGFNGTTPPPGGAGYNVVLPVYVCPGGVGTLTGVGTGCTAANGVLNPQNPFAAAGQRAQLFTRSIHGRTDETRSTAKRGVLGLSGSFGDDWRYTADFTASENKLRRNQSNYFVPQRVMDAAARGTFNWMDQSANSQAAWDFVAPPSSVDSRSKLWQIQGNIAKDLFELAGGPLQAAVGASYREESIDAPSGNPANVALPYERYLSINAVGASGSRNVTSAFFEVNAPVLDMVELMASGRFDDYSTGQSNFSPKLGFKITPFDWVALRGTWSEGFRIPSFNEAFGLPTTGYVSRTVNCATYGATFCAAHANNAYATSSYSLGLTQIGNPALDPEESTAYTFGLVLEPMNNVSVTLDFWRIEVENLIVGVTNTLPAETEYYQNNGVITIPGFNAVPGVPDQAFPNALPLLGFIESSFTNQDSQLVSGIDFGASVLVPFGDGVSWRSTFDLSYLMDYTLTTDAGDELEYAGTLSPCNITSCSGAPEYRASWQNTVEFGATTVSLTAYYTSGYDTASLDFGGIKGDCQGNADGEISTSAYVDGTPVQCVSKDVWNADLTVRHKFSDQLTVYADVLNVFGIDAPFDHAAAYGLFNFQPAWAGPNMLGRYFRLGVKMDL